MRVLQEKVLHPSQSFRFHRYETDAFRLGVHRHDQLELTWIERGVGLRLLGDSCLPFEAGDLVLIGPGVPHAWLSATQSCVGLSAATVVQFSAALLTADGFPELARAAGLAERSALGLAVAGEAHAAIVDRLIAMREASPLRRLAALIEILGLLVAHEERLARIASSGLRAAPPSTAKNEDQPPARRIDHVINWIHAHLADALGAADAARIAHVSTAGFSRFFRHEVGKPFTEYINDARCSAASIQLLQSDKPIAVIADECGFPTLSHFNRQFRLRVGVTPREFRRSGPAA